MMLSVKSMAHKLQASQDFVRSEIEHGNLTAYKIGRLIRIKEEDAENYLIGKRVAPRAPADNDNRKNATSAHKQATNKLRTILGGTL